MTPNGVISMRKLKTWVYLRLCLARACMRALALTCNDLRSHCRVEIKFTRKSTQVFHRLVTKPKSTQIE